VLGGSWVLGFGSTGLKLQCNPYLSHRLRGFGSAGLSLRGQPIHSPLMLRKYDLSRKFHAAH